MSVQRLSIFSGLLLLAMLSGCMKIQLPGYGVGRHAVHIVRPGETLYGIGKAHGVDFRVLARRNHIRAPYTIYVGQRIYLWRSAPAPAYLPIPQTRKKQAHAKPRPHHAAVAKKRNSHHRKATRKSSRAAGKASFVRLQWPVKGKITSRFGHRGRRMHDGIDIAAPEGAPIHAAATGTVVYADSRLAGYGKLIILRHRHNQFTAYAHNQRNLVRKGDRVKAGQVIAHVGKTGRATAPHLHFEIRRGSIPVDPLSYLP